MKIKILAQGFLLSLILAACAGAGSQGQADGDQDLAGDSDTDTDGGDDLGGDDQPGGDDTSGDSDETPLSVEEICTQICTRNFVTCLVEMSCDSELALDLSSCEASCVEDSPTEDYLAQVLSQDCESLNTTNCAFNTVLQESCECPSAATCDGGGLCLPLSGGELSSCFDSEGQIPADAPGCDSNSEAPVPCESDEDICVLTSADSTQGYCLVTCGE